MTARPTERKQGKFAAIAASPVLVVGTLVIGLGLASSAFATTPTVHGTFCSETHDATLDVKDHELTASLINHEIDESDDADKVDSLSADHLLRPRAAATIREVFSDGDDETLPAEAVQTDADDTIIMNTRVPGFSADELARFKRQMLRKDI